MPQSLKLTIDGIHCGGCVTRVTNALKKVDGVDVKDVQVGSAEVAYDETRTQASAIVEAVKKIGFVAKEA